MMDKKMISGEIAKKLRHYFNCAAVSFWGKLIYSNLHTKV